MITLKWPVVPTVEWGSYSLLNFRGLYLESKAFNGAISLSAKKTANMLSKMCILLTFLLSVFIATSYRVWEICYSIQDRYNNNNNNVKGREILAVIGATGTISKSFRKYVSNIP